MSNLAIIPVRTGSRRLPGKNTRDFFGKPMFVHTLEYARRANLFDRVLVSTESEEVAALAAAHGAPPDFLRPAELADDTTQLVTVCRHVLEEYASRGIEFDNFCLLWATAPMRTDRDMIQALELLDAEAEAVIGATEFDLPVFCAQTVDENGFMRALFPDLLRLPSRELPRAIVDNGTMCWVKVSAFFEHATWLPPRTRPYLMPRAVSQDIETQEDWELAEYYFQKYFLPRQAAGE